jgi:glycosyltransferase involved in cell wall biosynthesis
MKKKIIEPLVSVVIPTKNRKRLLFMAVKSVIAQTHKNLEIIIYDNNSDDGTDKFIKKNIKDPRVKYYKQKKDVSMTNNWQSAIQLAKGDYIVRLDDDCIFFNEFTATAIYKMKDLNLDMLQYSGYNVKVDNKITVYFKPEEKIHVLNKYEILFLEFNALVDSNFTIYSKKIISIFSGVNEDIYETLLPDRYLHYRIAKLMEKKNLRIGFSSKILGLSRFDRLLFSIKKYKYLNTQSFLHNDIKVLNHHVAFKNLCIKVILKFFKKYKDESLLKFFNDNILSLKLINEYVMAQQLISYYKLKSIKDLFFFNKDSVIVLFKLFKAALKIFENRILLIFYFKFLWRIVIINIRSIYSLIFHKTAKKEIKINTDFGDHLSSLAIVGKNLKFFINKKATYTSIAGSFNRKIKI